MIVVRNRHGREAMKCVKVYVWVTKQLLQILIVVESLPPPPSIPYRCFHGHLRASSSTLDLLCYPSNTELN